MKLWQWILLSLALFAVAYWLFVKETGSDPLGIEAALGGSGSASDSDPGSIILSAISSFENVASVHNNPGGICGSFIGGVCQGPATFDTLEQGTQAAISAIDAKLAANPALTVEQFVKNWSGASGQVLDNYVQHVADALGLDPSDPIADAGGEEDDSDG